MKLREITQPYSHQTPTRSSLTRRRRLMFLSSRARSANGGRGEACPLFASRPKSFVSAKPTLTVGSRNVWLPSPEEIHEQVKPAQIQNGQVNFAPSRACRPCRMGTRPSSVRFLPRLGPHPTGGGTQCQLTRLTILILVY